jgi:hypothetical protein
MLAPALEGRARLPLPDARRDCAKLASQLATPLLTAGGQTVFTPRLKTKERSMTRWLSIVFLLALTPAALAMEDTPQNREQQVDRYLKLVPPQAMFADMMSKISRNVPPNERDMFVNMMTKHLDFEAVTKAMRAAMLKTFTADELGALADFYGSPVGKSAMRKMGDYMSELMPVMMREVTKAQMNVQREMTEKQQQQQPK